MTSHYTGSQYTNRLQLKWYVIVFVYQWLRRCDLDLCLRFKDSVTDMTVLTSDYSDYDSHVPPTEL